MKRDMSNPIPQASGIYKITCLVNKKLYLGSTVDLRKRKGEHFNALRRNSHHNPSLQNAWNKYGEENFTFEVLELVLPMSLTAREQYWFNELKPFRGRGFNIAPVTDSVLGVKRSLETKEKLRLAKLGNKHSLGRKQTPEHITKRIRLGWTHTPETIKKMKGVKKSPEAIEKMRQTKLGKKLGKKRSPEAIEKMRQANLGRKRSPEAVENMRRARWGKNNVVSEEHEEFCRLNPNRNREIVP